MITSNVKKRFAVGLVAAGVAAGAMVGTSASADPAQFSALTGVGSDTTQDVLNAFAGRSGDNLFLPLLSGSASGNVQLNSFDATGPGGALGDCLVMKPGFGAYTRPNGSGNGVAALSRAMDGTGWGSTACVQQDVGGVIDFARSSSGPTVVVGGAVTFIPFGRDAVSFAAYRKNGSPVTTLSRGQLSTLFKGGTSSSINVGGVKIIACGIQSGSGTGSFWNGRTTANATQDTDATTVCRNAVIAAAVSGSQPDGRLQENNGVQLKAAGDAVAALAGESNTQVIIGFSAGAFIAKSNGKGLPLPPAGVAIGSISDDNVAGGGANLGSPVTGTAPNLAPSSTFFANTNFGRTIYNVVPSAVIDDAAPNATKGLFVGSTSAVCQATATLQQFGFLPATDCGATTARAAARAGQDNA
jgi:hypothetical protein